jgi:hypothetical protein
MFVLLEIYLILFVLSSSRSISSNIFIKKTTHFAWCFFFFKYIIFFNYTFYCITFLIEYLVPYIELKQINVFIWSIMFCVRVRSGHNFMVVWNYNYLYHQYIYPLIFVSLGPVRGEVYSIQLYVIKIVNNLR